MSQRDTIERAYGNAPKDIPNAFSFLDWIPDRRTVRYVWLTRIVRKFFR
jgi:hypothetical protein